MLVDAFFVAPVYNAIYTVYVSRPSAHHMAYIIS